MKKFICLTVFVVILSFAGTSFAVLGTPDKVPAATLIVPFFEVGISSVHDTLLVVTNGFVGTYTFHYHVWDIDGNPTDIQNNVVLSGAAGWSISMGDLIATASPSTQTQLTEGSFYQGFVTIDNVSSATTKNPTEASYPFANNNVLEGFIYYVRLLEGSSNGRAMTPIEHAGSGVHGLLQDFYQSDNREEIDSDARACASQLASGAACTGDSGGLMYRVHSRVFADPGNNGTSRIVLFTWSPGMTDGPSVFCDGSGSCVSTYEYRRYDEAGATKESTTIRLDHVVNVINVSGTDSGNVSIWNVPSGLIDMYIDGFSFNSASPLSDPSLNWDAIFDSYIWH